MSFTMSFGDRTIDLDGDVDVTELKSEIVRNAHAGGGWVAVQSASHGVVEVFVSAGQYLTLTRTAG